MKIKKGFIAIIVILVSIVGLGLFALNQLTKTTGYVAKVDTAHGSILIVSDDGYGKLKGNIEKGLTTLDSEIRDEYIRYKIPQFNDIINSEYSEGDKVNIYWNGPIQHSDPGEISNTYLIRKID